ncbi:NADP-dependent oxidoreductase [Novosphingobium profundi]|uniref:NADP-dependent oxidoreductase n=1 Tax=Novosphingobium profundi TaxID=1774954 RepID=UPI001BD987E5|nr:NADP-dependent oxidoreductase [Novosphingobium profundi]MBT0668940.1 NADP-dependent oxidoreductase [Novosphingobium profundi]
MLAALIEEYGSNDVVNLADMNRPVPGSNEVLVRVRAAGINPVDWKIRNGAGARMGMTLPIRLGSEFVGVIEEIGSDVSAFAISDDVFGMVKTGGFSEYLVVDAANIALKPAAIDAVQAATLPLAGTTAWQAMFDEGGLKEGQRLLITGASGGVGSLAVQLAKASGAHVTALASPRNLDFVRGLGADVVIDYTADPFEDLVRDIDVVFDTVGSDTFERAFRTLRQGGVMVTVVAFPAGDEAERFGVTVKRSFTVPNSESLGEIGQMVQSGKLTPHVDQIFPFSQVKDALELSEIGRVRGKIVLSFA